jgi:restriction system protein
MAIPDYQTLMLPVLRLAAEGEKRVVDVVDRVADDLGLSKEDRDTLLPSGRQRVLHNRMSNRIQPRPLFASNNDPPAARESGV